MCLCVTQEDKEADTLHSIKASGLPGRGKAEEVATIRDRPLPGTIRWPNTWVYGNESVSRTHTHRITWYYICSMDGIIKVLMRMKVVTRFQGLYIYWCWKEVFRRVPYPCSRGADCRSRHALFLALLDISTRVCWMMDLLSCSSETNSQETACEPEVLGHWLIEAMWHNLTRRESWPLNVLGDWRNPHSQTVLPVSSDGARTCF